MKIFTPNLAKVLAAFALLSAVFWCGYVGLVAVRGQAPGLRQGPSDDLSSIGGDHRLVRTTRRDGNVVVCSEGARQLQYVANKSNEKSDLSYPTAVLSTVYLREAGWQICNAYANGIIDRAEYTKLLSVLISGTERPAVSKKKVTRRKSRPSRRRRTQ